MLDISALKNMYPVIMTPSHDGKYFHNYLISLLNVVDASKSLGFQLQVSLKRGESLVTRARNESVAEFLENGQWTHLFWVDSDIGFSVDAFLRLLLSDYDVAAGVYPLKFENLPDRIPDGLSRAELANLAARYTVNSGKKEGDEIVFKVQPDGFMEMDEAPTGFMCIKREVFDKMRENYPHLRYTPDSRSRKDNGLHYRFFDVMIDPDTNRYLSEDYGFCYLWQQLGGKVYIDCHSNLTHQGAKLYQGNFAHSLVTNLPNAIGAEEGKLMILEGSEYLTQGK